MEVFLREGDVPDREQERFEEAARLWREQQSVMGFGRAW